MELKKLIDNPNFLIVVIVLIAIWMSFFIYLVKYGEEVRTDPCSLCSKRMGEKIFCTTGGIEPQTRTYYPGGEIEEDVTRRSLPFNQGKT